MPEPTAVWLFGDQLGPHFYNAPGVRNLPVLLIESTRALARHRTHRGKLHLTLSGMRHLAAELGERATLVRAETYRGGLARYGKPVVTYQPASHAAATLLEKLHADGLVTDVLPSPGFLLAVEEFSGWAGRQRRLRMEEFYAEQRHRFGVLLDGDDPAGGRYSYDTANREPPPKHRQRLDLRRPYRPREDEIDAQVRADLDSLAAEGRIRPVGSGGPRAFPATRVEARRALRVFTTARLDAFGPVEDAMLAGDPVMSHSLLSAPLNLGLLGPLEVIRAAEKRYRDGTARLSSVEGFIRQVLGWREYVRGLYWHLGPEYLRRNALGASTPLPDWWWELDAEQVAARCLRTTLAAVRDTGWTHHIQRLMILGNHALQRGYDPRELTEWFASVFADGTPWVMPPNVIGMSQYADGGLITTKPYAAAGAYIDRMSDYCRACPYQPRRRLGEDACPYTAGYWNFVAAHRELLAANPRTAQIAAAARRMDDLPAVVEQEHERTEF